MFPSALVYIIYVPTKVDHSLFPEQLLWVCGHNSALSNSSPPPICVCLSLSQMPSSSKVAFGLPLTLPLFLDSPTKPYFYICLWIHYNQGFQTEILGAEDFLRGAPGIALGRGRRGCGYRFTFFFFNWSKHEIYFGRQCFYSLRNFFLLRRLSFILVILHTHLAGMHLYCKLVKSRNYIVFPFASYTLLASNTTPEGGK